METFAAFIQHCLELARNITFFTGAWEASGILALIAAFFGAVK